MANVAIFDAGKTPNPITEYLVSVNTPDYAGRTDVLINPDTSRVNRQPLYYWKHENGQINLMTQQERDAVDAARAQQALDIQRAAAINLISARTPEGTSIRALLIYLINELNLIRRHANIGLPDRDGPMARTEIRDRINNGEADE